MEEEVKNAEVVEEAVVEEAPAVEAEPVKEDTTSKDAMDVDGNKKALIAFILAVIGISFACGWWAGIVGAILGIVGLSFVKKANEAGGPDRKPWSVFLRVAKPLCIVAIILGFTMFGIALIVFIVEAIIAAVAAAADAAANAGAVALLAGLL